MPKLLRSPFGHRWYCRACSALHLLPNTHLFDGELEQPTFSPAFEHHDGDHFCRYYIVGGRIQYDLNSTHFWAGRTVQIENVPQEYCP